MKARKIALKILEEGLKNSFLPKDAWNATVNLDERDRDLVRKLVYGTMRFIPAIDDLLKNFLKRPHKTPHRIKNILRMGVYEIKFLRIPPYATVNEYTNMTPEKFKGLVNAILRRISKNNVKIGNSLPSWLSELLERDLSSDVKYFLEKSLFHSLTLRSVKMKRIELKERLFPIKCQETTYSPWGLICQEGTDLRGTLFESGAFTFQDESSQMIAKVISPHESERILDACGGVGTKTTHLIQLSPKSNVIYNDLNEEKTEVALSNFKRMNLFPKEIKKVDILNDDLLSYFKKPFDKILLDAPCSALGTVGKHPDVLLRLKPSDIEEKANIQLRMLEKMWTLLKRGGILVYSVCTVTKAETDDVIRFFLESHADAKCVDPFGGEYDFGFNGFGVQLLKYMEGFYISKILKV